MNKIFRTPWNPLTIERAYDYYEIFDECKEKDSDSVVILCKAILKDDPNPINGYHIYVYAVIVLAKIEYEYAIDTNKMIIGCIESQGWHIRHDYLEIENKKYIKLTKEVLL